MHEAFTISVVDDDSSVREALAGFLRSVGYHVESFSSAEDFLGSGILASSRCIVLDVQMPKVTGPELQESLVEQGSTVPIIFMTGRADEHLRARVLGKGAVALLEKAPADQERLLEVLDTLVGR